MKFFTAALSFICLVAASQEASAKSTPAQNDAVVNGIHRVLAAVGSGLQSNSKSKSNSNSNANRKLEDFFDDDFLSSLGLDDDVFASIFENENLMQCVFDSSDLSDANPDLEEAMMDYGSSVEYTMDFDFDGSMTVTVEFPQETRDVYQQACSDAGGYYKETNGPIICDAEFMGSKVGATVSGFATCYANTLECKSIDLLDLATTLFPLMGIEGECSEGTDDTSGVARGLGASLRGSQ